MYAGVPSTVPVAVRSTAASSSGSPSASASVAADASRTSPKSLTSTRPSVRTSTLAGLKSRCTRPARCAATSPSPAATNRVRTSRQGWGRASLRPRIQSRRSPPSTNSMAMKTWSPRTPTSCTVTTFGCSIRARLLASRMSRSRYTAARWPDSGVSSLTATHRSSCGSNARKTMPIAPAPTWLPSTYRPIVRPRCVTGLAPPGGASVADSSSDARVDSRSATPEA